MALILGLILLLSGFLTLSAGAAEPSAPEASLLYHRVAGGEEDYLVQKRDTLMALALKKGVQWRVLVRQNDLKEPYRLKTGMLLKLNNTHIVPTELGEGLVINLPELTLYHFHQGKYQRRYALAVGKRSWPTPTGDYQILNKARNPTWVVPPSIQEEMWEQGLEVLERVPPGPKNPLGAYWMGTSAPGVGIHATNRPWSVGYYVSHGCIRMLPEEIAELFPQVKLGTPVRIIYRPVKLALTAQGRIFLEAHPNIYRHKIDAFAYAEALAQRYGLTSRIDWERVPAILKAREGVAYDITWGPGPRHALGPSLQAAQRKLE